MEYAMKYEELLCKLFNCTQDGDELQLASATIYDSNIDKIKDGKGFELRAGLYSALRKFQLTHVERKYKKIEDFIIFGEEIDFWIDIVFTTNNRSEIDKIITTIDNLIEEINREN